MKRSSKIQLMLIPVILTLSCNSNDLKHCVDRENIVVDEEKCNHQILLPGPSLYRWYYGGTNRNIVSIGTRISGGSYTPSNHHSYSTPKTTISRGGFGSTGRGSWFGGS